MRASASTRRSYGAAAPPPPPAAAVAGSSVQGTHGGHLIIPGGQLLARVAMPPPSTAAYHAPTRFSASTRMNREHKPYPLESSSSSSSTITPMMMSTKTILPPSSGGYSDGTASSSGGGVVIISSSSSSGGTVTSMLPSMVMAETHAQAYRRMQVEPRFVARRKFHDIHFPFNINVTSEDEMDERNTTFINQMEWFSTLQGLSTTLPIEYLMQVSPFWNAIHSNELNTCYGAWDGHRLPSWAWLRTLQDLTIEMNGATVLGIPQRPLMMTCRIVDDGSSSSSGNIVMDHDHITLTSELHSIVKNQQELHRQFVPILICVHSRRRQPHGSMGSSTPSAPPPPAAAVHGSSEHFHLTCFLDISTPSSAHAQCWIHSPQRLSPERSDKLWRAIESELVRVAAPRWTSFSVNRFLQGSSDSFSVPPYHPTTNANDCAGHSQSVALLLMHMMMLYGLTPDQAHKQLIEQAILLNQTMSRVVLRDAAASGGSTSSVPVSLYSMGERTVVSAYSNCIMENVYSPGSRVQQHIQHTVLQLARMGAKVILSMDLIRAGGGGPWMAADATTNNSPAASGMDRQSQTLIHRHHKLRIDYAAPWSMSGSDSTVILQLSDMTRPIPPGQEVEYWKMMVLRERPSGMEHLDVLFTVQPPPAIGDDLADVQARMSLQDWLRRVNLMRYHTWDPTRDDVYIHYVIPADTHGTTTTKTTIMIRVPSVLLAMWPTSRWIKQYTVGQLVIRSKQAALPATTTTKTGHVVRYFEFHSKSVPHRASDTPSDAASSTTDTYNEAVIWLESVLCLTTANRTLYDPRQSNVLLVYPPDQSSIVLDRVCKLLNQQCKHVVNTYSGRLVVVSPASSLSTSTPHIRTLAVYSTVAGESKESLIVKRNTALYVVYALALMPRLQSHVAPVIKNYITWNQMTHLVFITGDREASVSRHPQVAACHAELQYMFGSGHCKRAAADPKHPNQSLILTAYPTQVDLAITQMPCDCMLGVLSAIQPSAERPRIADILWNKHWNKGRIQYVCELPERLPVMEPSAPPLHVTHIHVGQKAYSGRSLPGRSTNQPDWFINVASPASV